MITRLIDFFYSDVYSCIVEIDGVAYFPLVSFIDFLIRSALLLYVVHLIGLALAEFIVFLFRLICRKLFGVTDK